MNVILVLMCFLILFVVVDFLFGLSFTEGCGLNKGIAYVNFGV